MTTIKSGTAATVVRRTSDDFEIRIAGQSYNMHAGEWVEVIEGNFTDLQLPGIADWR